MLLGRRITRRGSAERRGSSLTRSQRSCGELLLLMLLLLLPPLPPLLMLLLLLRAAAAAAAAADGCRALLPSGVSAAAADIAAVTGTTAAADPFLTRAMLLPPWGGRQMRRVLHLATNCTG